MTNPQAKRIIENHVVWAMGGGLMPIPLLDIVAVTAIQMDMLRQLTELYDMDFDAEMGKSFVSALTGSTFAKFGSSLIKGIPVVGSVIGGISMMVLSGASTYAVGQIAVDMLEREIALSDVDIDSVRGAYDEAFEEGKGVASRLKRRAEDSGDVFTKISKLGELRDKGYISDEEFETHKQKLLERI